MSGSITYQIIQDGENLGDFTEVQARQYLAEGTLHPDDLGWAPHLPTWQPLGTLFPPAPPVISLPPQEQTIRQPQPLARTAPPPLLNPLAILNPEEESSPPVVTLQPRPRTQIVPAASPPASSVPLHTSYVPQPSLELPVTIPHGNFIPVLPAPNPGRLWRIILALLLMLAVFMASYLIWKYLRENVIALRLPFPQVETILALVQR